MIHFISGMLVAFTALWFWDTWELTLAIRIAISIALGATFLAIGGNVWKWAIGATGEDRVAFDAEHVPAGHPSYHPRKPHLVVTDCYGGEIETPNIDALASGGVRFSQFYYSGHCCPTRATLLTGLHPHQTGIGHMTNSP